MKSINTKSCKAGEGWEQLKMTPRKGQGMRLLFPAEKPGCCWKYEAGCIHQIRNENMEQGDILGISV